MKTCFVIRVLRLLCINFYLNLVPANINRKAATKIKGAKEKSLRVLPKSLRNENSKDFALFKNHLDIFLSRIPDQPTIPGFGRAAASNSLVDQISLIPDLELG